MVPSAFVAPSDPAFVSERIAATIRAFRVRGRTMEAMPVRDRFEMPASGAWARPFIFHPVVAMSVGTPLVTSIIGEQSRLALWAFFQRPSSLDMLAEFVHRGESKSRTSRVWTTAASVGV